MEILIGFICYTLFSLLGRDTDRLYLLYTISSIRWRFVLIGLIFYTLFPLLLIGFICYTLFVLLGGDTDRLDMLYAVFSIRWRFIFYTLFALLVRILNLFIDDAEVYQWDLRMRRCMHRFMDDGAVCTTHLAVSNTFFATGSQTGIVNLYRATDTLHPTFNTTTTTTTTLSSSPKPYRALPNLSTPISALKFNHDGQLLFMASGTKNEAARLVHLPSARVYQNWPFVGSQLDTVQCVDFSPEGRMMAVGNCRGRVFMYRLNDYQ